MFAVPAPAARDLIAYAGLAPAARFGRAVCSLAAVRYADGDLGAYHEFAVAFLVRDPVDGGIGAFIHWLPVNQSFTLEAGRSIWGFPKEMADIPLDLAGRVKRCAVRFGGRTALELAVRPGAPLPTRSAAPSIVAFSHLDGVTRRIPWTVSPTGVRMRPGGATLRLGDHRVADELRALGLDGARALSTSTVTRMTMSFAGAEEVR
ncbi:acetoacetate decarboxylase family protein [Actinomadura sp. PM05-2]|uniref:Acetoacetate decarboxylase family protein n=2 Tax=Actinomadura parmotrematis TaxID=2864039 RepID=A0ABS7FYY3_9ACTN|nr:acetoacetate decarboxylase family protein [Actinomadura parmotrematis]